VNVSPGEVGVALELGDGDGAQLFDGDSVGEQHEPGEDEPAGLPFGELGGHDAVRRVLGGEHLPVAAGEQAAKLAFELLGGVLMRRHVASLYCRLTQSPMCTLLDELLQQAHSSAP